MRGGVKAPALLLGSVTGGIYDNGIPSVSWIAMGLKEGVAPGWFNGDPIVDYEKTGYSAELLAQSAKSSIRASLKSFSDNPEYAVSFFGRKIASMWNNPTFEGFQIVINVSTEASLEYWMKDILYNGGIANTILTLALNIFQSVYWFGILLFLIFCGRDKKISKAVMLIMFVGAFIFHIFWEAKSQYAVLFFVPMLPYAVRGYEGACRQMDAWVKEGMEVKILTKQLLLKKLAFLWIIVLALCFFNNSVANNTIKLRGGEREYVWACVKNASWKE